MFFRFGALVVLVGILSLSRFARATAPNISGIKDLGPSKYRTFHGGNETNLVHRCQGTVPSNVNLANVNLKREDLNAGVDCLIYDFDGNGSLDFMIYGKATAHTLEPGLVIFFKGDKADRTQILEGVNIVGPLLEGNSERKKYPQFKGRFGLIQYFGGDGGVVFFYDPKSGLFRKEAYVFPPGSGDDD